jgi:hypothetical protein
VTGRGGVGVEQCVTVLRGDGDVQLSLLVVPRWKDIFIHICLSLANKAVFILTLNGWEISSPIPGSRAEDGRQVDWGGERKSGTSTSGEWEWSIQIR